MNPENPSPHPFHVNQQIAVVRLEQWLDWVTGADSSVFVALPMIQRGSVWPQDKVVNLWDSLLRGMPVGGFTVSVFKNRLEEQLVRRFGEDKAVKIPVPEGGISLVDGQQRTLAMCIGWHWPSRKEMDRRIWVDFGQRGTGGHPFCLRVTTRFQPFGFNPSNQSQRIALWQRREARKNFDQETQNEHKSKADYQLPLDQTHPYRSCYPLVLQDLVKTKREEQDLDRWANQILGQFPVPMEVDHLEAKLRIRSFGAALERLFRMEIALLSISDDLLKDDPSDDEQNVEPPLVVLFERIANAGTRLSPSDYVFALIKHRFPAAHNLVQQLHSSGTVACLLSANELVMTAVRIAAGMHRDEDGKTLPDNPSPNPKEFNQLVRRRIEGARDFLGGAVFPLLGGDSEQQRRESLQLTFFFVQSVLEYRRDGSGSEPDAGLPRWAFPLLQRPLVQVLAFWIHQRLRSTDTLDQVKQDFENSRLEVIRFILFWLLCVNGKEKDRENAGKIAFKNMRDERPSIFPGKRVADLLCQEGLAVPIQPPTNMLKLLRPAELPGEKFITSHRSHYRAAADDGLLTVDLQLTENWLGRWNLLLWLQRRSIAENPAFQLTDPLAGPEGEQETPYDFDHITPCGDWGRDGRFGGTALFTFCENSESGCLGDNIGNVRVWDSSSNRSDSDSSPAFKLGLLDNQNSPEVCLRASDITDEEAQLWKRCSPEMMEHRSGDWNSDRARLFKQVVEQRAYRLYQRFYAECSFQTWEGR